jgi:hypothetical protein
MQLDGLLSHSAKCTSFDSYLKLVRFNGGNRLQMRYAQYVIVCKQCNMQFPLFDADSEQYATFVVSEE